MKLDLQDFARLRPSFFGALTLFLAAAIIAALAYLFASSAAERQAKAQAEFQKIDRQLRQVNFEELELRDKAALFQHLQQRGIFGPESRLDWSEQLGRLRQQWRLPLFSYEFSPQSAIDADIGGYTFVRSGMKLHMHLWHEEDLLRILESLRNESRAQILLRSCRLSRIGAPSEPRPPIGAQLDAECEMDWVTAHPTGGK